MGVSTADLDFYPELADIMVEKELALRQRVTETLDYEKDAALTLELTVMARSLRAYIIDRSMQKRLMAYQGLKSRKKQTGA